MSKKKKGKKKERKPIRAYKVGEHFQDQLNGKYGKVFDKNIVDNIINERVTLSVSAIPPTIKDSICHKCRSPKRYITEREMPLDHDDYKIVACVGIKCEELITIFYNERKHGNTPIRPDQVAKGITKYNKPCCGAEVNLNHKTVQQVIEACDEKCETRKVVK